MFIYFSREKLNGLTVITEYTVNDMHQLMDRFRLTITSHNQPLALMCLEIISTGTQPLLLFTRQLTSWNLNFLTEFIGKERCCCRNNHGVGTKPMICVGTGLR